MSYVLRGKSQYHHGNFAAGVLDFEAGLGSSYSNSEVFKTFTPEIFHLLYFIRSDKSPFYSVAISPDAKILASTGNDTIDLHKLETGKIVAEIKPDPSGATYSTSFSPGGSTLASVGSGYDRAVTLWDLGSKQATKLSGHSESIKTVAFSPDGKILASGGNDDVTKLWDASTDREICTLKGHKGDIYSVAFHPNGDILATGSEDSEVRIWDLKSVTCPSSSKVTLQGHSSRWVRSVIFSPDGETLVSAGNDKLIQLWNWKTGKIKQTLSGHDGYVTSLAISSNGKLLASGGDDGIVKIWDMTTGMEVATLLGHSSYVQSVAFSPDGKTIASGAYDKTIRVWRLQ